MTVRSPRHTTQVLQVLVLRLAPHGGQAVARRNAWVALSEGSARARSGREAVVARDGAPARTVPSTARTVAARA